MRNNLNGFIKDIVPVLVGVLIALLINSWNDARKDQDYMNDFYISLKKEFQDTNKEIIDKTPYQNILLDTLEFYLKNEDLTLIDILGKAGGLKGPRIRLNYWKSISDSKLELMSYEKLSILADIEDGSELLTYKRNKLLDFIYENLTVTGSKEKMILKLMLEELVRTQRSVQKDILKILND